MPQLNAKTSTTDDSNTDPTTLQTSTTTQSAGFRLYSVEELEQLPDPSWLIDGHIPQGSIAELYGEPGIGKSFLALDWSLSVASDSDWLGNTTHQSDVVYVCAEGSRGIKKRIAAWQATNPGTDLTRFAVLPESVDIPSDSERAKLLQAITASQVSPGLIVLDTLARCFGSGDENSTKDMNAFVAGLDRIRSKFPESSILVVHHSGKDPSRGDRGSTVLRGAADTMLELKKSGQNGMSIACVKQKDWEPFDKMYLSLRSIEVGDGDQSCVVVLGTQPSSKDRDILQVRKEKAILKLPEFGEEGAGYSEWRKACKLNGDNFKPVLRELIEGGIVYLRDKRYFLVEGQGSDDGSNEVMTEG